MTLRLKNLRIGPDLVPLARTLASISQREEIPPSRHRLEVRARLLNSVSPVRLTVVETKIGWIGLAWSAQGLVGLQLPRKTRREALLGLRRGFPEAGEGRVPTEAGRELCDYAEGKRHSFNLPLDWSSVKPFQKQVLQAACKIPCGETRSYGWVARRIGKPRASRAVGRALATNPIPIVLPCHRVIGSDGGLHGYGGGLPMKAMLLKLEGANLGG